MEPQPDTTDMQHPKCTIFNILIQMPFARYLYSPIVGLQADRWIRS